MHSCIAALSSNVPTLALGWSHKYRGIMKEVGLERYVFDNWVAQLDHVKNDLIQCAREIYLQKEEVITTLKERSKSAEVSAMDAAQIAIECMGIKIKNDIINNN
jgi:polysaccharide pyruvyl transferase WcaK-like protein